MSTSPTPVLSKTFTAAMHMHGSWGSREVGTHASTMDLYLRDDDTGFIEWDIPSLYTVEEIGLTFTIDAKGTRTLLAYDGIMALPGEAVDLMREAGIVVSNEFEDRCKFLVGDTQAGDAWLDWHDAYQKLSGYEAGRGWIDTAKVGDDWRSQDGTLHLKRVA